MSSIIKVNTFQDANGNALFSSDGSGNVTTSATGLQMTPAFHVRLTGNQNVSDGAQTKVNFNDVTIDTDSCWDTGNYRFTPTVAGKYYVYAQVTCQSATANNALTEAMASFRINGVRRVTGSYTTNTSTYATLYSASVAHIFTLNGSSDYVEVYGRSDISTGTAQFTSSHEFATYFMGYKIIGA
jgi:hypothetical protein